jgi:hypothetical protein
LAAAFSIITLLLLQLLANMVAPVRRTIESRRGLHYFCQQPDKLSTGGSCPHCRSKAQQHAL